MVYGAEAVLPADIAFRSPHAENFDEDRSDDARELEVNCSEERRLDSYVRMAKYLAVLRRYYNRNAKEHLFVVGDLVLKWKTNHEGMHKLSSP
jgi:metal-dependent HD superfamily phosphatase/phosphodiesterase